MHIFEKTFFFENLKKFTKKSKYTLNGSIDQNMTPKPKKRYSLYQNGPLLAVKSKKNACFQKKKFRRRVKKIEKKSKRTQNASI